uniref:rRNA adenine N(6)-methyltransferase n=1 Tax=Panagrellus redivivus TaxID=6233 RepID=A0A7E4VYN4_PANRE
MIALIRLSIVTQFVAEPKLLFVIPGNCFVPKPEVDVGVVKFVPRIEPLIPCDFAVVEKVARHVFIYRQKYVIKCVKTMFPEETADEQAHELLRACRIDPTTRPFKLGVDEIGAMCVHFEAECRRIPGLFLYDHARKHRTLEMLANEENAIPPEYTPPTGMTDAQFDEGVSLRNLVAKKADVE